jgi:acyl carrier protein
VSQERRDIEARVIAIVAETLSVDAAKVKPHSSLIDELGAESIDFLDMVFRIESAFGIKVVENEIWAGAITPEEAETEAGRRQAVERLKARLPEFPWDAFPATPRREDLPRLITVRTIVDYLEQRL